MFLVISLLASSIDGFICGFLVKSTGIKFSKNDYFKIFLIIFSCCLTASISGKILYRNTLSSYINYFGGFVMLYLAYSTYKSEDNNSLKNPATISISLATDASIVCMYLGMSGYNFIAVSLLSAIIHTTLMLAGAVVSKITTGERFSTKARYIARIMFLSMAVYKFIK